MELKGKVKSITGAIYSATVNDGKSKKKNLLRRFEVEYDDKGNLLTDNEYSRRKVYKKKSYTYNMGNRIEADEYSGKHEVRTKETYKYNESGNMIEKNSNINGKNTLSTYTYKYFENEKIIEENTLDCFIGKTFKVNYRKASRTLHNLRPYVQD